jgi:hypothetical protein
MNDKVGAKTMNGNSMSDEEFIKLSHFDRIRRGYFDKIPLNFMLIGVTIVVNVFASGYSYAALFFGIAMFSLGTYLKDAFIEKDDIELKQKSREIEEEFRKREPANKKGQKR